VKLLAQMTQAPPLCLSPKPKAILMRRTATSWSGKTLMWLLVCLVAIGTSDDFWSIAMASSSSQLLIVADDDDPNDSAARMPACVLGDVVYTDCRWFVRKASDATEPANLRGGFVLRNGPRGPPADASAQRGRTTAPCFSSTTPDSSILASLLVAATPHHTSFKIQTPTDFYK
jgi:hypothetical protein